MHCFRKPFGRVDLGLIISREFATTLSRGNKPNYYDILRVKPSCTTKDVRNAFIELSKEFHPDKNRNDKKNHLKFVQLNEAYSVLSRPERRNEYDRTLNYHSSEQPVRPGTRYYYSHADEQIFWKPEHKWADAKGKKNLSKSWIVILCFIFTSVGVGLQIYAIRRSLTFSRDKLDELSEANGKVLSDVRKSANENSKELQLEIIRQRLEDSANRMTWRQSSE